MENATQALLIASGILIALVILTLIIFGISQVSNYYTSKEQAKVSKQLIAFNKQYNSYDRDDVRGTELISLIYKIIDFNKLNSDDTHIEISINLKDTNNKYNDLYYMDSYKNLDTRLIDYNITYDESNIEEKILKPARQIEDSYDSKVADKLAINISKVIDEDEKFFKELNLSPDDVNKNDILKYYQYQHFKRAHFNCEKLEYTDSGRVLSFNFKFNGKFE